MGSMLLAAAGFARLGVWQLSRLRERRAANVMTVAARNAAPVTLTPLSSATDTLGQHRVVARGRYDFANEIVIRGDVFEGVPGVRVVTPLLLDREGPAVLVERGFLPTPDAVTVDARGAEEPGELTVRGIAVPVPLGGGEPIEHDEATTWRRLDLPAIEGAAAVSGAADLHQADARQRAAVVSAPAGAGAGGRGTASRLRDPVVPVRRARGGVCAAGGRAWGTVG
jgi:Uncharacterized conserved protein